MVCLGIGKFREDWIRNTNDSAGDFDGDGYTNLEEYLNYLVISISSVAGDFDGNNKVTMEDLPLFINDWLVNDPYYIPAGDLYGNDNFVNFRDFAIFAENWMK